MSRTKRVTRYLFFTLGMLLFLYLGSQYGVQLKIESSKTINPFPYYIFSALFPILFGMILGLPNLYQTFCKLGDWVIDWIKLFVIGVPTLILDLNILLIALTPVGKISYFTDYNSFIEVMIMDSRVITLSGTIFGYILVSSITKKVKRKTESLSPSKPADFDFTE